MPLLTHENFRCAIEGWLFAPARMEAYIPDFFHDDMEDEGIPGQLRENNEEPAHQVREHYDRLESVWDISLPSKYFQCFRSSHSGSRGKIHHSQYALISLLLDSRALIAPPKLCSSYFLFRVLIAC